MRTHKDVEAYLLRMGKSFQESSEGMYLVRVETGTIALKIEAPLVLTRIEVGPVPAQGKEALYEHLLSLNATALVHAAYGIDGGTIILCAALELENLDYNELDAVIAEMDLGLSQQIATIRHLAGHNTASSL